MLMRCVLRLRLKRASVFVDRTHSGSYCVSMWVHYNSNRHKSQSFDHSRLEQINPHQRSAKFH